MTALSVGDNSYFMVDGIPYQRGDLLPEFFVDDEKLRFVLSTNRRSDKIGPYLYSEYIDASTGLPFDNWNAIVDWCKSNVFAGNITVSAGGSSGLTFSKVFKIVAAPVADNEKAAGATIQDDWLKGVTPTVMIVNGIHHTGADITHNDVAGTIGMTGEDFLNGDTIIILLA